MERSSIGYAVCTYLIAIVLANLILFKFGPIASIFNAFFLIGLDLTLRDSLHDYWDGKNLWLKMFALICSGSLITILLNFDALQIAIASAAAFGLSGIADAVLYHLLRNKDYLIRSNGSNIFGSSVDSIAFPTLAFGVFMPQIILFQFLAKFVGGFCWSLFIHFYVRKDINFFRD